MNESGEPLDAPLTTQMLRRESDRGCVLVGAAILEEALDGLVRSGFVGDEGVEKHSISPLLAASGPLGSLWAKTQLTNAMGLLSADTYHDLEIIRKLRNRFAHQRESATFSDADVVTAVDRLATMATVWKQVPRHSINDGLGSPTEETEMREGRAYRAHKAGFACTVVILMSILRTTASVVRTAKSVHGRALREKCEEMEKMLRDGPPWPFEAED